MDKVIISTADVYKLLEWRNAHKDLVRKAVCPFRAIELIFPDTKVSVKGFRYDDELKLQVSRRNKSCGSIWFQILPSGMVLIKTNRSSLSDEEVQDCLTVYMSLMAMVVYASANEDSEENITTDKNAVKTQTNKHQKSGVSITYLISKAKRLAQESKEKRERKHPTKAYSVRGHFRHYKSGKVVWIEQHTRCDGKKKSKVYKLGGGMNDYS